MQLKTEVCFKESIWIYEYIIIKITIANILQKKYVLFNSEGTWNLPINYKNIDSYNHNVL